MANPSIERLAKELAGKFYGDKVNDLRGRTVLYESWITSPLVLPSAFPTRL